MPRAKHDTVLWRWKRLARGIDHPSLDEVDYAVANQFAVDSRSLWSRRNSITACGSAADASLKCSAVRNQARYTAGDRAMRRSNFGRVRRQRMRSLDKCLHLARVKYCFAMRVWHLVVDFHDDASRALRGRQ